MNITSHRETVPWLLLIFSLPSKRTSERVRIWRKLQKYGTLPLRNSGYVLPNTPATQERLEWLATAIRNYRGQASVVQVQAFDDLPDKRLRQLFVEARSPDYERLLRELRKIVALSHSRRPAGRLSRLRRQFQEVEAIDFFVSPLRGRVESLLARAEEPESARADRRGKNRSAEYLNQVWMTRP